MFFFRVLYESQYAGAIGTGSLKQVPTLDCFWTSGRGVLRLEFRFTRFRV